MGNRILKRKGLCACLALLALLLSACGSELSGTVTDQSVAYSEEAAVTQESPTEAGMAEASGDGGGNTQSVAQGRKLIKTVALDVETADFDALTGDVERRVEELGGYVENSDMSYGGDYEAGERRRNADYTVRVPADRLSDFVKRVEESGSVVRKSESVEDVTLNYVDIESRKKALETEQERLTELLKEAQSVEAVISIEERLSDIRYEIENFGSQLRVLDNQVDYGTVYIHIREVRAVAAGQEEGIAARIASGFANSVANVLIGIRELFVGFVIALPYLFCIAVFVLIVYLIVRAVLRREGKREPRDRGRAGKKGRGGAMPGPNAMQGSNAAPGSNAMPGPNAAPGSNAMQGQPGPQDKKET